MQEWQNSAINRLGYLMLKCCPSTPLHKKCVHLNIIIERTEDKASGKIGRVSRACGEGGLYEMQGVHNFYSRAVYRKKDWRHSGSCHIHYTSQVQQ